MPEFNAKNIVSTGEMSGLITFICADGCAYVPRDVAARECTYIRNLLIEEPNAECSYPLSNRAGPVRSLLLYIWQGEAELSGSHEDFGQIMLLARKWGKDAYIPYISKKVTKGMDVVDCINCMEIAQKYNLPEFEDEVFNKLYRNILNENYVSKSQYGIVNDFINKMPIERKNKLLRLLFGLERPQSNLAPLLLKLLSG